MTRTCISVPAHKTRAVVNCLHGREIEVVKGRIVGDRWLFYINASSAPSAEKILKELAIDYKIVRHGGAKYAVNILKINVGLILAVVIAIIAAVIGAQFVFGADIDGDDPVVVNRANEVVEELGLTSVNYKRKIDTEQVKATLYESVERLAFVSVKVRGSRLKISTVAEKEILPKEEMYSGIYASCDGIITSITVLSGTAVVKEGDTVLKGDMLIEGKRSMGTDDKGEEIYEECEAAGSVTARVWISSRITHGDKYTTFVRTGNSESYSYIDFFGKQIGSSKPSPYACYDTSVQVIRSYSILPYNVIRVTYYETFSEIREATEGELDVYIFEESRRLRESIEDDAIIINTRNFVKKLDNLYVMDIYYEVEKNIAYGV